MTWRVDTHIIERFGQAGAPKEKISMVKRHVPLHLARQKAQQM
jgi:hypothetical protein